ncbi:MAG TPA: Phenylacetic acid catabolic protein [Methylomirabilota bacterium]|nr:Phenylacetic acid catabolic protein [Methylomirabilota bacterium]
MKIATFDDWVDLFHAWQKEIGYDSKLLGDYRFEAKLGETPSEIEFGDYRGQSKWERLTEIPDQRVRDSLLHLIVYQGDTEFASVEQQKRLIDSAPSDYDLQSLVKINREEMRHGVQMCYLLANYFGSAGLIEARKLLERRAGKNRLLSAFNLPVTHWLDFFCYTQFMDRDGKYQLTMLSHSAFAPLAKSMGPMLKEEFYHLLTGNTGLQRIVKAGQIPIPIIQKYFNKWVPACYDLFGTDHSSTAHWAYVWGLKGRYDELTNQEPAAKDRLNDLSRALYHQELQGLTNVLNSLVPEGKTKLIIPDEKFHRELGACAGKPYSVTGELLSEAEYARHLAEVLPSPDDELILEGIFKERDWIIPVTHKQAEAVGSN